MDHRQAICLEGSNRLLPGNWNEGLGRKIVDLRWSQLSKKLDQVRQVLQVGGPVIDSGSVRPTRAHSAPPQTNDVVVLVEEQTRKVVTILAMNAGNEGCLLVRHTPLGNHRKGPSRPYSSINRAQSRLARYHPTRLRMP